MAELVDTRRPVSILVVDDDDVDVMAIKRGLKKANMNNPFFVAHNGLKIGSIVAGDAGADEGERPRFGSGHKKFQHFVLGVMLVQRNYGLVRGQRLGHGEGPHGVHIRGDDGDTGEGLPAVPEGVGADEVDLLAAGQRGAFGTDEHILEIQFYF